MLRLDLCGGAAWGAYEAGVIDGRCQKGTDDPLMGHIATRGCRVEINGLSIGALNSVLLAKGVLDARESSIYNADVVCRYLREFWGKTIPSRAPMARYAQGCGALCKICCCCPIIMLAYVCNGVGSAIILILDQMLGRWGLDLEGPESRSLARRLNACNIELSITVAGDLRKQCLMETHRIAWGSTSNTSSVPVIIDALKASMCVWVQDDPDYAEMVSRHRCWPRRKHINRGVRIRMHPKGHFMEGGEFIDAANPPTAIIRPEPSGHVPTYSILITPCPANARTQLAHGMYWQNTFSCPEDSLGAEVIKTPWVDLKIAAEESRFILLRPFVFRDDSVYIQDMYQQGEQKSRASEPVSGLLDPPPTLKL